MGIFNFDLEFSKFIVNFHKKRAEKGIKAKIFLHNIAQDIGERLRYINHTQVKYFKDSVTTPAVFLIYENKILIRLPDDRTFIKLSDKKVADSFRKRFYLLWGQE